MTYRGALLKPGELVYDGTVWHTAFDVPTYYIVGSSSCWFTCGRHAIVQQVARPGADAICADCMAYTLPVAAPQALSSASVYAALGNGSRQRTATGIVRQLLGSDWPQAADVSRARELLDGLHHVGLCTKAPGAHAYQSLYQRHP